MISGTTGLIGLLGQPVSHSLSPVMHNAALKAMDLDWRYLALPCEAEDLEAVLDGLKAVGCRGLNVTIPHKQQIAGLCRELSPLARRLGAVNTLTPLANDGWHGHNTDAEGFLAPLQEHAEEWRGSEAVVLGCGGSARAVGAGLQPAYRTIQYWPSVGSVPQPTTETTWSCMRLQRWWITPKERVELLNIL